MGALRRLLSQLTVLASLGLCACNNPGVTALHDPLYRASPHVSTITATGVDSKDGIDSVSIAVTVGTLTACNNGGFTPSLIPCRTAAFQFGRECIFSHERGPAVCRFPLQLGDRSLVTYTATARNSRGSTAKTTPITYAAGAPLTQATIHVVFFDITVPWETARPVWWHTDLPLGQAAPDKIDVGFFPDADWGTNYQGFTDGLQVIALGSFFNDTHQFSNFYRFWKNEFNLWAGPAGGNGEDSCVRSLGGAASTVSGAVDGKAIVHQAAFRDCSDIALGGLGTSQSTLTDAAWVFTHESGHFLHGLGDEYQGGGNGNVSDPPNTWASKAACQSAAPGLGLTASQCAQIGTTGFWHVDDGGVTTMRDRDLASDWRTASGVALSRRISKCTGGACY
ncbi:hypothetical protein [Phenylobacterium sp.]|uniref:hypothetical protein n=1 Tax=Phenylobacterium sp. TaxID=1871053 RepID=UPI00286A2F1A|nr:hypothetical protein [Phenylobacterium sp.]